ncbi:DUF4446 family protein [Serpentinicella alkaliphila]|uniref:Uncharacterized protein DUF4446 n=1 Tax=Serpentinicella alkaliphila TaxID=1734049 RepID=A0A4R2TLX6_9FIRM|nr:DUF4446 family protein [Serpentinicella alkaliphila]QUH25156.1 DUF4446 family protein [Serpentinicella alkaliphila]TCQ02245.1 uncharacterized protein DUF4446 [Serpentinicella alkaliphila]
MDALNLIVTENVTIFILASLLLNLILIFLLVGNYAATASLKDKYKKLTKGMSGKNIESILLEHMERIDNVSKEFENYNSKLNILDNKLSFGIQKVGFIRYNAFSDVGSDLSYSIALLDQNDNGFILTGIHGRAESYTYAKSVKNGVSNYHISTEEEQALERAKNNYLDGVQVKSGRVNK